MTRLWLAAGMGLLVAGCGGSGTAPTNERSIPYVPDLQGLRLLDRPLRVDFGRTDHSTLTAMRKIEPLGPKEHGTCSDGLNYVLWSDGLRLVFNGADFVGWENSQGEAGAKCSQKASISSS